MKRRFSCWRGLRKTALKKLEKKPDIRYYDSDILK